MQCKNSPNRISFFLILSVKDRWLVMGKEKQTMKRIADKLAQTSDQTLWKLQNSWKTTAFPQGKKYRLHLRMSETTPNGLSIREKDVAVTALVILPQIPEKLEALISSKKRMMLLPRLLNAKSLQERIRGLKMKLQLELHFQLSQCARKTTSSPYPNCALQWKQWVPFFL